MPRRPATARTAKRGLNLTQDAVEDHLGWIFREQSSEDYGVDAHFEVVDGEEVRGWLLGIQIKCGPSYFRSPADDGWWFVEDRDHFAYWLGHSIPIVVVLVDPGQGLCFWQLVTKSTVVESDAARWKLRVPRSHVLDETAREPLRAAAEAGVRRAREIRQAGAPIAACDAAALEVHAALPGAGAYAEAPPEYFRREHDELLDDLVGRALGPEGKSGRAVLVGPSGAGKTRALYEALHRPVAREQGGSSLADAGWRVWPSLNPLPPGRFLDELAAVGPRTVVWLNEAQRYLKDPSAELRADIATALRELLSDAKRGPVLVLGTLWREYWNELAQKPDAGPDDFVAARLLLADSFVRVPDKFTNAEVSAARKLSDRRMVEAAERGEEIGLTQFLSGAPDLLRRYETASAGQLAVIHAAMDARRLGHREVLGEDFLRDAARCYFNAANGTHDDAAPTWFDQATEELMHPGKGGGPLLRRTVSGYRLDDWLDQEGRRLRQFDFPPEGFWSMVTEADLGPEDRLRLAESAAARHRLRTAVLLYETVSTEAAGRELSELAGRYQRPGYPATAERLVRSAVAAGYPEALMTLARLRSKRDHDVAPEVVSLLRQAIDRGVVAACEELAFRLELNGDREEAEAVARKGVELGSSQSTSAVASWRDLEHPDEAERLIHDLPAGLRRAALADFVLMREGVDDPAGAERFAFAVAAEGDSEPLLQLASVRAEYGQKAEARDLLGRIAWQPETIEERLRLALIHAFAGNHAQARSLVAAAVDAGVGSTPRHGSTFEDIGERLATFAEVQPQAVTELSHVLKVMDERLLAERLFTLPPHPVPSRVRSVPDEDDDVPDQTNDEIGDAYVTLSAFHARRGEFHVAEAMALRAADFGYSAGLAVLADELCRRDRRAAERLALCAVNMDGSALPVLAKAREDDSLLLWGLEADGGTAEPW